MAELMVSHPVFQWLFRMSWDWSVVEDYVSDIRKHAQRVLGGSVQVPLSLFFKEIFILNTKKMSEHLQTPFTRSGILYDRILSTGQAGTDPSLPNGKGQMLFLIRQINGSMVSQKFSK